MDVDVAENPPDNGLMQRRDPGNTLKPILQDTFVSGASFPQLFFWNRVLFVTSIVLCLSQCLASGLVLANTFPAAWPGNELTVFDMWLPELFGGLLGLAVAVYCRNLLLKVRDAAQRAEKSYVQGSPQLYIPWSGANHASRVSLLWMLIVPGVMSLTLLGVSAVSLAISIRVVRELRGMDDPDYGHAVGVLLLCLHLLIVLAKLFVVVLSTTCPVVLLIVAKWKYWAWWTKRVYPFALYLDGGNSSSATDDDDNGHVGKPLLIEL
ncbi:hypothetical protein BV898_07723 [Hypsibius exemplaris]|uniref:Uncharacterized protein n=1 Tax=Hypsibius exemplaris TaxID=2072580 RepID=A0A1W0WSG8_HYPEX|nr:hypothetical protein BV898_07723 [Hypsibius exemplaris]